MQGTAEIITEDLRLASENYESIPLPGIKKQKIVYFFEYGS